MALANLPHRLKGRVIGKSQQLCSTPNWASETGIIRGHSPLSSLQAPSLVGKISLQMTVVKVRSRIIFFFPQFHVISCEEALALTMSLAPPHHWIEKRAVDPNQSSAQLSKQPYACSGQFNCGRALDNRVASNPGVAVLVVRWNWR